VSEELPRLSRRRRAPALIDLTHRVTGPGAIALVLASAVIMLSAASVHAVTAGEKPAGDPVHGQTVYQACMGCHSLDEDDVGPRHRGVVGRLAGSVPSYAYSTALKGSHIVWSEETLDRWLTNPQGLVPGAKMFFSMSNAQDRADVIAYLAQQH
jgi:cytochrome c